MRYKYIIIDTKGNKILFKQDGEPWNMYLTQDKAREINNEWREENSTLRWVCVDDKELC